MTKNIKKNSIKTLEFHTHENKKVDINQNNDTIRAYVFENRFQYALVIRSNYPITSTSLPYLISKRGEESPYETNVPFVSLFERRLDNVLVYSNWAKDIRHVWYLLQQRWISVNNRIITSPDYPLLAADLVSMTKKNGTVLSTIYWSNGQL